MRQKVDRWIDERLDLLGGKDCFGETQEGEFYFDDEPLDQVLYGAAMCRSSPANLFLHTRQKALRMLDACKNRVEEDIYSAASELAGSDCALSRDMCRYISSALCQVFPYYPNPELKQSHSRITPLFEKMWRISTEGDVPELKHSTGTLLYRSYEYQRKYVEARQVLDCLMRVCQDQHDRQREALYLNNLGFEYFLEKRWADAIPYFEKAARMFQELDIRFEFFNARANYLLCRLEFGEVDDSGEMEREAQEILSSFTGVGRWYERKPLILMVKIEEKKGNIHKAIALVEKAIESAKDSNTRYPELDAKYLNHLKKASSGKPS